MFDYISPLFGLPYKKQPHTHTLRITHSSLVYLQKREIPILIMDGNAWGGRGVVRRKLPKQPSYYTVFLPIIHWYTSRRSPKFLSPPHRSRNRRCHAGWPSVNS